MARSQTSKSEERQVIWGSFGLVDQQGARNVADPACGKIKGAPSGGFAIDQRRGRTLPGRLLIADKFSLTVSSTADFVATTGREE